VSEGPWFIGFTRRAEKDLQRLDPKIKQRVVSALDRLASSPGEHTGVRRLTGRPDSRIRVGDWRVIFETDRERRQVIVHRILPRGRAYDR
jgi:mRNA interferase RelE/StbE